MTVTKLVGEHNNKTTIILTSNIHAKNLLESSNLTTSKSHANQPTSYEMR